MATIDHRVVIIETDYELVKMYRSLIDRIPSFQVVGVYRDGVEAIKQLSKDEPDVVTASFYMEKSNNFNLLEEFAQKAPRVEIIALINFVNNTWVHQALSIGVSGIILKSNKIVEIEKTLGFVVNGGAYLSPEIFKRFISINRMNMASLLSSRETEVLRLMSDGLTYSMIASNLNISKETSRSHMKNIYKKLKVSSKAGAIDAARKDRII